MPATANPFRALTKEELLKLNLLWLVQDHRAKCDESCNVSLCLVREIAERAGITFSKEEQELFA
jgi:hypothetical protein